ncbi:hypothetical protein [Geoglobus acetivorans]|uniref:Uncharacterized protein n=1 Tax=Geoglobus acetivorans TaxID=565033 RepID=A0ABZ3H2T8_GEOAI|nr:hypothetical protein [Geoglobus acetivorans]
MMLDVFDDRLSLMHIVVGALSFFYQVFFVVFVFYEVVEHIYLAGREKEANFLGDFVEFLFGLGAAALAWGMMA